MEYLKAVRNKLVATSKTDCKLMPVSGMVKRNTQLTCMFGSFVFLQFVVLALANHAGEGYLSTGQRELVYYALQVFVILGYLLYSLLHRFNPVKRVRNIAAYSVLGIFFFSASALLTAERASRLYVDLSMAAALCLGIIGGAVHLRMSLETAKNTDTARSMSVGSAAAALLQYLLQIRAGAAALLPLFMLAAFFTNTILLFRFKEPVIETDKRSETVPPARILFSVLITAAFLFLTCFYNEYIHHLQIRSNYHAYNVYSWPRLMLIPGYLLFAVIGGRKNGNYVPLASLCIMLFTLLITALIGDPGVYWLNMCLFYFVIAAFTSYYLLTFWRLAPGTKHPALWAPMGRVLDSAVVLAAGMLRLDSLSIPFILGLDIAIIAMIILLMAIGGDFNINDGSRQKLEVVSADPEISPSAPEVQPLETPSLLSPDETLEQMRGRYLLTRREMEVLRELVLTEDKQTVISERLDIRVKTLQDHVTRLYRKTGVSTRAGLTDLYHENRSRH